MLLAKQLYLSDLFGDPSEKPVNREEGRLVLRYLFFNLWLMLCYLYVKQHERVRCFVQLLQEIARENINRLHNQNEKLSEFKIFVETTLLSEKCIVFIGNRTNFKIKDQYNLFK